MCIFCFLVHSFDDGVCGMKDLLLIYIFTGAAFIGCAIYLEVKADKYRVKVPVIAPFLFGAGLAMLISVVAVLLI